MLISQLTEMQRSHMAWRLDAKTACGMLTACRIARLDLGDMDVADVFVRYGGRTPHSAKCHAAKVAKFMTPNAEFTWRRRRSGATNGSASTLKQENER